MKYYSIGHNIRSNTKTLHIILCMNKKKSLAVKNVSTTLGYLQIQIIE
jgi:hypothetical protein